LKALAESAANTLPLISEVPPRAAAATIATLIPQDPATLELNKLIGDFITFPPAD
jgi:hypothetical protein